MPLLRRASAAETTMRSKPARLASATRRSLWLLERSSPVRLISPIAATRGGSGVLRSADAMARATARSAAAGFGDAPLALAAGTKFARQADLPDCRDPRWKWCIALRRRYGESDGEVGRGFVDTDSACNC